MLKRYTCIIVKCYKKRFVKRMDIMNIKNVLFRIKYNDA